MGSLQLLRFRPDPAQADPDPRYYQFLKGMLNVTAPMQSGPDGSGGLGPAVPPIFLSAPHYCGVDPGVAATVRGLKCDKRLHDLFLDVGECSVSCVDRCLEWELVRSCICS
jgi:hypothetical protein